MAKFRICEILAKFRIFENIVSKGRIFSKLKFVEFWQSSEYVKISSAKGEIFSKLKFVEFWQSSGFVKILSAKGEIFCKVKFVEF